MNNRTFLSIIALAVLSFSSTQPSPDSEAVVLEKVGLKDMPPEILQTGIMPFVPLESLPSIARSNTNLAANVEGHIARRDLAPDEVLTRNKGVFEALRYNHWKKAKRLIDIGHPISTEKLSAKNKTWLLSLAFVEWDREAILQSLYFDNVDVNLKIQYLRSSKDFLNRLLWKIFDPFENAYLRKPLHYAASNDDIEIATILLLRGARVNDLDYFDQTPLNLAVENRCSQAMVKLLLESGAKHTVIDNYSYTALHHAAEGRDGGIVILLIDAGVDVDGTDRNGRTALHHAASGGHLHNVEILLDADADPNIRDDSGNTSLHVTCRSKFGGNDIVDLLITAGANFEITNNLGEKPFDRCY